MRLVSFGQPISAISSYWKSWRDFRDSAAKRACLPIVHFACFAVSSIQGKRPRSWEAQRLT